jgi:hypothetical protein
MKLWLAGRIVEGVRGKRKELASASSSSSSAVCTHGGSDRTARCFSLFSALALN